MFRWMSVNEFELTVLMLFVIIKNKEILCYEDGYEIFYI